MSIILRNTKNMFSKEQKVVTGEFLERWDNIEWEMPIPESRISLSIDDHRRNYKAVYK